MNRFKNYIISLQKNDFTDDESKNISTARPKVDKFDQHDNINFFETNSLQGLIVFEQQGNIITATKYTVHDAGDNGH